MCRARRALGKGAVMDRLNPLDAVFVDAEDGDPHVSMAIASIAVFEGPAPSHEEFLAYLAGRLPRVPRYRHKLRTVPFRLGRPVWVEDPDFDLRYHVRRTALPAPGGDRQLAELMARVMSQRLDRDHPLWEYWVAEGLSEGRWALISKVHHCMVDGVSGTDLYGVIFDFSEEPLPPVADDRTVNAEPSAAELAARAALDAVVLPVREAVALSGAVTDPAGAVRQAADTVRAMAKLAPALWPATGSSLNGPIGRQRRYTWARVPLDDVKAIKQALGGTVNDVVLAAISGGFRSLLLARGEEPGPHMVRSLVPVSVRAPGEENVYENQVSALLADLPVHLADPAERLAAVQAELRTLKASKEAMAGRGPDVPRPLHPVPVRVLGDQARVRAAPARDRHGHHKCARPPAAALRDGPPPPGDHPVRPDRHDAAHRDLDLHLLRRRHLRHHRRLRRQPRPGRAGPRHRRRYIGTEESRPRQPAQARPLSGRPCSRSPWPCCSRRTAPRRWRRPDPTTGPGRPCCWRPRRAWPGPARRPP